jgi:hypothetical protein
MKSQILLTAFVIGAVFPARAGSTPPAPIAERFYEAHQKSSQDGVPDAAQRAKYEPYMTSALTKLLAQAAEAEKRYAKANRDSPPMVEGDLFSSNFEGISTFRVNECTVTRASARCHVQLRYAAQDPGPQDKPVDWTDTVTLLQTGAGWRIDDIAFGGKWAFGNHGALKSVLEDVIADARK